MRIKLSNAIPVQVKVRQLVAAAALPDQARWDSQGI